ncbi:MULTISPECIES: P27 family phage terminase small subunit [unclassified Bradyrhizobium]|uniref:P27 family phage terminase small subunit n=1 Tax=unclassified Bradyrhizobium TaxID=2631580 RepID=UPI00247A7B09|nr:MULTISPECIES: P27 family phage terminase small subunit [unclassified Bradyrhizobium]WGR70485.1 P27 family phage terminase small subunit [Bradyrhizobium sp. ISRA426]WGR82541.1 P27 family phage terminase small subunit [Bradyrhizobium sp. ISRA430]WGR85728.1 P27 family phage terminase small subunit [Bradyrhizobium sp. ISRA432]
MRAKTPKAPAHLTEQTRIWWRSVVRDYALEPHHLRLLQAACEAWDRLQEARELLLRDGLVVEGREGGVRPHPTVAIERDSRIGFARLVRELDLDTEPASSLRSAPPALRSNRRGL